MATAEQQLSQRLRELRRRHFGPRGKSEFAARLSITPEEYQRFENGAVPPGDVLVRICQVTGEDLQWLLTGLAARGTMVISGARDRHQALLARVAQMLNLQPAHAGPLEAFIDLLDREGRARTQPRQLPAREAGELIPILREEDLPDILPDEEGDAPGRPRWLATTSAPPGITAIAAATAEEPGGRGRSACELCAAGSDQPGVVERQFVQSGVIAGCFPDMFGLRIADDSMNPMFDAGDVALVSLSGPAQVGRPALCRLRNGRRTVCRIWLGDSAGQVQLGCVGDGADESVAAESVGWALEVLYRVRRAA